jgi:hypothetical protein
MKRSQIILLLVLTLLCVQTGMSQIDVRHFTFGIVSTEVFSQNQDHKITDIKNPVGVGGVLGYQFNDAGAVGLTVQYMNGNIEQGAGTEKDVRTFFSVFVYPLRSTTVRPYVSAGMVYTHRTTSFDLLGDQTKDLWHARMGVGAEYSLLPMVTFNLDFGAYNDGMRFVAGGASLGLRFAAR